MNRDESLFKVLTHLISTKKYTNTFPICRSTGAQIQIKISNSHFFHFLRAHIFDVRPLALTYIKMLKIGVGPRGQIDQKLKCYFSNKLFLAENIFYYYAILFLCFITSM